MGGQAARIRRVVRATHVEARVIQLPPAGTDRQERHVRALGDQIHHRPPVVIEARQAGETRHAVGTGRARQQGLAVHRHHRHRGARHRLAAVDGLHEHILAAVVGFFHQHAQIGDHDQAAVGGRVAHAAGGFIDGVAGRNAR